MKENEVIDLSKCSLKAEDMKAMAVGMRRIFATLMMHTNDTCKVEAQALGQILCALDQLEGMTYID
jgi:hypothetical protein